VTAIRGPYQAFRPCMLQGVCNMCAACVQHACGAGTVGLGSVGEQCELANFAHAVRLFYKVNIRARYGQGRVRPEQCTRASKQKSFPAKQPPPSPETRARPSPTHQHHVFLHRGGRAGDARLECAQKPTQVVGFLPRPAPRQKWTSSSGSRQKGCHAARRGSHSSERALEDAGAWRTTHREAVVADLQRHIQLAGALREAVVRQPVFKCFKAVVVVHFVALRCMRGSGIEREGEGQGPHIPPQPQLLHTRTVDSLHCTAPHSIARHGEARHGALPCQPAGKCP
jgi:hypothetical protein